MAENAEGKNIEKLNPTNDVWVSTLRLTLNLLSHVLICLVLFVCLWFSCRSYKLSVTQLHIVLCVLGYQFFMSQGILVLTRFNSWSLHVKRRYRINLHWCFEAIGTTLILVGTIEIVKDKRVNFNTTHGILGLCALITTLLSVLNGVMTSLATKISYNGKFVTGSKWIHGVTGIGTLFLSGASLHYGFEKQSFRKWIDNENFVLVLKIFTWIFTILVVYEFWFIMARRIMYKSNLRNGQRS